MQDPHDAGHQQGPQQPQHGLPRWALPATGGVVAAGILASYFAGCFDRTPQKTQVEVFDDHTFSAYVDGEGLKQYFLNIQSLNGRVPVDYPFQGDSSSVKNWSRRLHKGDIVAFYPGNLSSLEVVRPYPAGEIPVGRNLVVKYYEIEDLRNFNRPSAIEDVIGTLKVNFTNGNVDETYIMRVTARDETEAEQTVRNLQQYNVVKIKKDEDNGIAGIGGERGGERIKVKPTEDGLELIVPAHKLVWSDLRGYDVLGNGRPTYRSGKIHPDYILEPWKGRDSLRISEDVKKYLMEQKEGAWKHFVDSTLTSQGKDIKGIGSGVNRLGKKLDSLRAEQQYRTYRHGRRHN